MSKDDKVLYGQDEAEKFVSKSRSQSKKEISRKLNKGRAFHEAMQSPVGQVLLKKYEQTLDRGFLDIINFKHDDKVSDIVNYHNILAKIVSYNAMQRTGNEWSGSIRELQEGIKEMREENEKLES